MLFDTQGQWWNYSFQNYFGNAPTIDTSGTSNLASNSSSDDIPSSWRNWGYATALMQGLNSYSQAKQLDSQAALAESNRNLVLEQSSQTGRAGATEANATREKGRRMNSSAQAAFGASGVDANVGSAGKVQSGIAYRTERDAQTILKNTNQKMWGLTNEANKYEAQAENYRRAAKTQRRTAILNTALQVAKIYYGVGG